MGGLLPAKILLNVSQKSQSASDGVINQLKKLIYTVYAPLSRHIAPG